MPDLDLAQDLLYIVGDGLCTFAGILDFDQVEDHRVAEVGLRHDGIGKTG